MTSWRTRLLLAAALSAALTRSAVAAPNPDARQAAAPPSQASLLVVQGAVFSDEDRDRQWSETEAGLANLKVRLVGWKQAHSARTDADGAFRFHGLAAGGYRLELELPEGTSTTTDNLELRLPGAEAAPVEIGVAGAPPAAAAAQETSEAVQQAASESTAPEASITPARVEATDPAPPNAPDARDTQQAPAAQAAPEAPAAPEAQSTEAQAPLQALGSLSPMRPVTELRFAKGRDLATQVSRKVLGDGTLWLGVPFRSQVDGTAFQAVNCGPASLSMVLAAFGLDVTSSDIRDFLNWRIDNYDTQAGTSLEDLTSIARLAGVTPLDLYGPSGFREWSVEAIRWHVEQGNPVITLVKYRELPGRQTANTDFDHYVVITGATPGGFIFNDSAFGNETGYGLAISERELEEAWAASSIPRQAVAMAVGSDAEALRFPFPRPLLVTPPARDDWARDPDRMRPGHDRSTSGSRFVAV